MIRLRSALVLAAVAGCQSSPYADAERAELAHFTASQRTMSLAVAPILLAGRDNLVTVSGLPAPSSTVHLAGSLANLGRPPACPGPLRGDCLDLPAPAVLLATTTGTSGVASLLVTPPVSLAGHDVHLQGVSPVRRAFVATEVGTVQVVLPEGDEDLDGLDNETELALGTDAFVADTDGDGTDDGVEVGRGTDPLRAPTCLTFDELTWRYFASGVGSFGPSNNAQLLLIPDNRLGAAVAALTTAEFFPPYRISLAFSAFDDDFGDLTDRGTGDGFGFSFAKDPTSYDGVTVPGGGARGVVDNGTGFSVEIDTFGSDAGIKFNNGTGGTIASVVRSDVYRDGAFVPLVIDVTGDRVLVTFDDTLVIDAAADTFAASFGALGVSAGTGIADSEQIVRDFCVEPRLP